MKKKIEEKIEKYRAQRDELYHRYDTAKALKFEGEMAKLSNEIDLIRNFIADLQEIEQKDV